MGWMGSAFLLTWAQTSGPASLAPLALRRWCAGVTLCSPESVPSLFGFWTWLMGVGGLLVLALLLQGPGRTIPQLLDFSGHARLVVRATNRLRRCGLLLVMTIGSSVLSWTGSQSLSFDKPEGREDLLLLVKSRGIGELAIEQGIFAGLTPLRDVLAFGGNLPLLVVATFFLFRSSADQWGGGHRPMGSRHKARTGWVNFGWVCGGILILYRLVALGSGGWELPLGGCLMVEALVIPALMAIGDGLLLAWMLVELRGGGIAGRVSEGLDPEESARLIPVGTLACLAALPARYLAAAVLLASYYLPTSAGTTVLGSWVRWQLGLGLARIQGVALLFAGFAGAAAWSGGSFFAAFKGYYRLLANQGGHLVVLLVLAGLAAGTGSAMAYLVILSLPSATWVLNAADGYAHYATLPIGLWTLSALVELAEEALPEAVLLPVSSPAEGPPDSS
ncbi:MAG: hypothetical protein NVSMB9_03910 [Isosphaeraceae bacterium]